MRRPGTSRDSRRCSPRTWPRKARAAGARLAHCSYLPRRQDPHPPGQTSWAVARRRSSGPVSPRASRRQRSRPRDRASRASSGRVRCDRAIAPPSNKKTTRTNIDAARSGRRPASSRAPGIARSAPRSRTCGSPKRRRPPRSGAGRPRAPQRGHARSDVSVLAHDAAVLGKLEVGPRSPRSLAHRAR
jgi:hypothetical protein